MIVCEITWIKEAWMTHFQHQGHRPHSLSSNPLIKHHECNKQL